SQKFLHFAGRENKPRNTLCVDMIKFIQVFCLFFFGILNNRWGPYFVKRQYEGFRVMLKDCGGQVNEALSLTDL
ncbi:MAG: hypothetical protein MUQ25_14700, partial [Candidatus Aminicenantes bacterium]|nr:hypothetical protein [Candidatus Aminicenantes bacterium]